MDGINSFIRAQGSKFGRKWGSGIKMTARKWGSAGPGYTMLRPCHKSTTDLLLNIHTHVLSFKQDSFALENATTLRVTIKLRNFSKVIIVWDTGITNYTIWNDLNRSERSKWVGARFSAAQLGLPPPRACCHTTQTVTQLPFLYFRWSSQILCCFSFSLFELIHFKHQLCFKAKQTLHGFSFVQENIFFLGCPWVGGWGICAVF